jgi:hypothetical protein
LIGHLAILKEQQSWDGPDSVLGSQSLLIIYIHFADSDPAIELFGQFIQDRSDHLAGPAPFGPEIDQHGRGGFEDLFGEIFLR